MEKNSKIEWTDGKCNNCGGSGNVEHACDCDLCMTYDEDCYECDGTGDCEECDGAGFVSIEDSDNDPTKY